MAELSGKKRDAWFRSKLSLDKCKSQAYIKISLTCTAMYKPGTLKDSNIISAVYSLFSGVFSGGSVYWI